MRFTVTVCPATAPAPVSVLGYSFPSYCAAYAMPDFSPFAVTMSTLSFTPSFPSGTIVTIWLFGAVDVLNRDFAALSVQCPVWTSCAQPVTETTNTDNNTNANLLHILPSSVMRDL